MFAHDRSRPAVLDDTGVGSWAALAIFERAGRCVSACSRHDQGARRDAQILAKLEASYLAGNSGFGIAGAS